VHRPALIHAPPSGILCRMTARPLFLLRRLLLLPLCLAIFLWGLSCSKDVSQEKVLNVYIWSEYLPQSVLDDFKAKTGITVHVANYDSNEILLEKLQSGVTDYDIVVPSDYMVHRLIARKLIRPIDKAKLAAGFANLDPKFLSPSFDPGNQYSVPYFWGTTGIGYNKKKLGGPVDSWDALFDPKYAQQILMLEDGRELFAAALLRMGKSVNETDPAVLAQAAKMLKEQKSLVRDYNSSSFQEKLASHDVVLAQGYNGQFAKAIKNAPEELAYVVPKEGGTFWMDNLCVPTSARHSASIDAFLAYVLQPEVSARIAEGVGYGSPNAAARKLLKPEVLNNEVIYPPEEVLKRCKFMEDLGESAKLINQYVTEIRAK
jgi:spermidine/putrescine-binding protein